MAELREQIAKEIELAGCDVDAMDGGYDPDKFVPAATKRILALFRTREAAAVKPWRELDVIGMKLATNCSHMYPGYTQSVACQYLTARALLEGKPPAPKVCGTCGGKKVVYDGHDPDETWSPCPDCGKEGV